MRPKRKQRLAGNVVVRHWAAPFVLAMLVLRSLIPAGFMLAPVNGGLAVVLCDGDATAAMYGHTGHDMSAAAYGMSAAVHGMSGAAHSTSGHDMPAAAMAANAAAGTHDMSGHDMSTSDMADHDMADHDMAGHDASGHGMPGHPAGHTHPDPTCPFAQSAGATPLPFLAALAPAISPSAHLLPDLVAQTHAHFGPTRQQSPRGPPRLA